MKKKIFWGVVFVCLVILLIQIGKQVLPDVFGIVPKAGLKITSSPDAVVYINGIEAGKTPFQDDNLSSGEYLIKLTADNAFWQGKIQLNKGTISAINRSLAVEVASSSGESLVLDQGSGVVVTSNPAGADVEIDGKVYGKTPLSVSTLTAGTHFFNISHTGYLKRSTDVSLPPDLSLHINVDLALSMTNLPNVVLPTIIEPQKIIIKQTQLGYLRLRAQPNISSKEVGQVSSGDELLVIMEVPGWFQVRLPNNQEGYVSAQYAVKK